MRVILALLISISAAFLFIQYNTASASETYHKSWRCGNHLVQIGDSVGTVLSQCGEPTNKTMDRIETNGIYREKNTRNITRGAIGSDSIPVEAWFYNCGSYGFNTTLYFKGNNLYSIVQESYGSGESYCNGIEENPNNRINNLNKDSSAEEGLINAKKEQIEEQTYQMRMKAYDDRIKALNEEADKYRDAHESSLQDEELKAREEELKLKEEELKRREEELKSGENK